MTTRAQLTTPTERETRMATTEEIQRRVEQADADRSTKRAAAAKRVGELARQRTQAAEKLAGIEHELGDVLVESSDVISVAELAKFTDVPATDLNQWLNGRRTTRSRRKRTNIAKDDANDAPPTAKSAATDEASAQPELAEPRKAEGAPARIPEPVT